MSPQTLSIDDRRRLSAWAAGCADGVLAIFERAAPGDGAHALGAAGYAANALALESGDGADDVVRAECTRLVAKMDDVVAHALGSLSALGENTSGPLGPGRVTVGHVGQTIRAVQAELRKRTAGQEVEGRSR